MLAALTSRLPMDVASSAFGMRAGKQRLPLLLFCAVSITLHALALCVGPQSGMRTGDALGRAPTVLHAVLRPMLNAIDSEPANSDGDSVTEGEPPAMTSPALQDGGRNAAELTPSSLLPAGAFPVPDQWFSADEVSVRAEPLTDVQILYPAALTESAVSGRVTLLLHIDERGVLNKAQVEESIPEGVFDRAALNAWTDVQFSPALKDGIAVKSRKLLEISFLP